MADDMRKRGDVALVLRRAGYSDLADTVERTLPDPVTLDEVARLLAQYGVTYTVLTDRMGGSP